MILRSFTYKDSVRDWSILELSPLKITNLIVGRNSTGKTKTIESINKIALSIKSGDFGFEDFSTELSFERNNDGIAQVMTYSFGIKNKTIEYEKLISNDVVIIDRIASHSRLYDKDINPPTDKLIVQIQRDAEYKEIEYLMSWAEGVSLISISEITSHTNSYLPHHGQPISFYEIIETLNAKACIEKVIEKANSLGYIISKMECLKVGDSGPKFVTLLENGTTLLVDIELSNGMLRTLYILSFLEYTKISKKPSLLIIDDISEGLDYNRAIELGKLIYEYCEQIGLQLIASSNDAFVMDVVDIDKWQILSRNGSKVIVQNQHKDPNLFEDFKLTGLNNFDLFSSDFIYNYQKTHTSHDE